MAATDNDLQSIPVFCHYPAEMFSSSIPVAVQNEILARGIPESTPTIGAEEVKIALFAEEIDMMEMKPVHGLWPQRDIDFSDKGNRPKRWLHTDLMNLPHFFTYKLFQTIVDKGELK